MRTVTLCLILLTGLPLVARAQGNGASLLPEARPGDRLTITTRSGARFSGRLIAETPDAVVVRSGGSERSIARTDIERVTRRQDRFLFGPLIGLGAGLGVGLPLKRRFDNENANGDALLALSVGLGLATGVVIDLTNGRDRTLYERRPRSVHRLQLRTIPRGAALEWSRAW
jgi:hypothetical protein